MKSWFSEHEDSLACMNWSPQGPEPDLIESLWDVLEFTEWFDSLVVSARSQLNINVNLYGNKCCDVA